MKDLEGWILQMANYYTITQTHNKAQQLAYIGLCTERDSLEWWKSNKHRFNPLEEVKEAIRQYYGNHYKLDRAFTKIRNLKQTDTVQKYLNYIDRLNVYAKMTDYHLLNIIINSLTSYCHKAMAHYKDLRSDPDK